MVNFVIVHFNYRENDKHSCIIVFFSCFQKCLQFPPTTPIWEVKQRLFATLPKVSKSARVPPQTTQLLLRPCFFVRIVQLVKIVFGGASQFRVRRGGVSLKQTRITIDAHATKKPKPAVCRKTGHLMRDFFCLFSRTVPQWHFFRCHTPDSCTGFSCRILTLPPPHQVFRGPHRGFYVKTPNRL